MELNTQTTGTPDPDNELRDKYLTFWTDQQLFGVPIADVMQIVGMQEITQVPEYPYYAKGIINLRGEVIPVLDMRLRLGKNEIEYHDRTNIIVINHNDSLSGIIVDGVDEVTTIPQDRIAPPPSVTSDSTNRYLKGIARYQTLTAAAEKTILLLDMEHFLE